MAVERPRRTPRVAPTALTADLLDEGWGQEVLAGGE